MDLFRLVIGNGERNGNGLFQGTRNKFKFVYKSFIDENKVGPCVKEACQSEAESDKGSDAFVNPKAATISAEEFAVAGAAVNATAC